MLEPNRILIAQTAFLGDVVLTLPLVNAVAERFPEARIDFLINAPYRSFIEQHPLVSTAIPFDKHGYEKGIAGTFRLTTILRAMQYDLALIPHRSFRTGLITALSLIPQRIGFARVAGSMWYTDSVFRPIEAHEGARNLALLKPLDEDIQADPRPHLELKDTPAAKEVDEWIEKTGIRSQERMVALAPGSVWPTKRWPAEHWSALLGYMEKEDDIQAVFVGGPEDRDLCNQIRPDGSKAAVAAGELSVAGSAALIERCELLITGDTAPLHLAQAVQTPTLAIFGPTVPEFGFAPTGENDRIVGIDLSCRPCAIHGGKECPLGHHHCMKLLTAEQVWDTASRMLDSSK